MSRKLVCQGSPNAQLSRGKGNELAHTVLSLCYTPPAGSAAKCIVDKRQGEYGLLRFPQYTSRVLVRNYFWCNDYIACYCRSNAHTKNQIGDGAPAQRARNKSFQKTCGILVEWWAKGEGKWLFTGAAFRWLELRRKKNWGKRGAKKKGGVDCEFGTCYQGPWLDAIIINWEHKSQKEY